MREQLCNGSKARSLSSPAPPAGRAAGAPSGLTQEGADIIAVDVPHGFDTVPYDGATEADLAETVKMVESLDRRIVARQADVRDLASLRASVDAGLSEFGHIDIVIANAGIASFAQALDLTEEMWQDMIDINLTGLWKTVKAAAPSMVERGQGGSIFVLTSSVAGIIAFPALAHYTAAKHGVVGLMRSLAMDWHRPTSGSTGSTPPRWIPR